MGERLARARSNRSLRPYLAGAAALALAVGGALGATAASASGVPHTATPIKHLVVIFDENITFDHYFGTYPFAANTDGTQFTAQSGTPTVDGLLFRQVAVTLVGRERLGVAEPLWVEQVRVAG